MKRLLWTAFLAPFVVFAQETTPSLQWGGSLRTDNRVRLEDPYPFSWNEHRLNLNADVRMPSTRFHAELWIRSLGTAAPATLAELQSVASVDPVELLLREAYVEVTDFLLPGLDLRAGKQRIAWGRADRLNPTDNLNPYDLEDLWDFGRHLGSTALVAAYYPGEWTITAALIPTFTPAVLPAGDLSDALGASVPTSVPGALFSQVVELPGAGVQRQATAGIRVGTHTSGIDWSVSCVYGREQLPVPVETQILPAGGSMSQLDVRTRLVFPRTAIVGFDLAGELGDVGVWCEGAAFFPTRTVHRTSLPPLSSFPYADIPMLTGKSYVKYVLGADYTFPANIYCNVQYLHGFIHERDPKDLHDYLVLRAEWTLPGDRVKVAPLNGALEIGDPADVTGNMAVVYAPEVVYLPYDNIELVLGLRLIDGTGNTTFSAANELDEACLRITYSF